ncbi:T9SS type A sorting domain-containing protein [Hymenobacter persicinus]|uniref:T9SS type A sorting domain-containing protein n=1 Tax=Hymenobacter persicinus TaxID=2025506 RepID=A0A4Q5LDJ1_9BACT|nr:T9SS type A sorting domain-containing protein [Hymenobacter persicinus]RYU81556.1 T9SS type A sorting domain-containing protein [Hymenobacter persicinus]
MRKRYSFVLTLLLVLLPGLAAFSQTGPTLTVSPSSLGGFTTAVGTPSAQQSALVNGTGLTGNVTATAPAGYEVSWISGSSFGPSITLTQAGGLVTNVPLYIRLVGAALGPLSGTVTVSSPGATTQNVAVSGTVTAAATPNPPCVLTSISPTSGIGGRPLLMTFYGTGFVPGATVSIQINAASFTATYISSTQLQALVNLPSVTSPQLTYLLAANPPPGGGGSSPQMRFFTVNPGPPIITGFSPASGPVGTQVTIRGSNLSVPGTSIGVSFNGTAAQLAPRVPLESEVYVVVPAGATSGLITLTNSNGAAVSAQPFTVTAAPPAFFENFEAGTKTSYAAASVALSSGGWTLAEALLGTTAGIDKFNGLQSARLRGGGILEMDTDKPNGAGVVTIHAAAYSNETGATFLPEISTDGGVTYSSLLGTSPPPTLTANLTAYSFTANRVGPVRLRISSSNRATALPPRLNLDDISITNYTATSTRPGQRLAGLQVCPNPAHGTLTVALPQEYPAQVTLYDVAGRCVLAAGSLPATRQLTLPSTLPAGLYLLRVQVQDEQRTVRVVKN